MSLLGSSISLWAMRSKWLRMWSMDRETFPCAADHHKRSVTGCCFDPDSQKVASVSLDKSVKIWDITSQATLLTINT